MGATYRIKKRIPKGEVVFVFATGIKMTSMIEEILITTVYKSKCQQYLFIGNRAK